MLKLQREKIINQTLFGFFLYIIINLFSCEALAISLEEAITIAKLQSTEVQIEEKRSELTSLSKADAATMFLPNASINYHNGNRDTKTSTQNYDLKENTRTITVSQPLFNGFQGISRVREAIYKSDAAKENLKAKKIDIALAVAESYIAIFKLRNMVEIDEREVSDYKKIIELARQRLKLKDISYSDYNDYENRNQNIIFEYEKNKNLLHEYELRFENLVKQKADKIIKPEIISKLNNFENIVSLAKTDNPKIKSAHYAVKAAKSAVNAERGKLLPRVAFSIQRDNQKSSYYFGGSSVKTNAAYLDFTIPIFQSGSEYASIAKAGKEKQIAELEHKLVIEEVEKAVKDEHNKFLSLSESFVSFSQLLNSTNDSLALVEDRFKKKDISYMELLLKKVEVEELRKQVISVESDALISYFTIRALSGEL